MPLRSRGLSCEGVNTLSSKDNTLAKHPDAQAASPEWTLDEEGLGARPATRASSAYGPLPAVKPPRPNGGGPGQDRA